MSNAAATGIPNEESTLIEFDEGSLWALDRLPGSSAYEHGDRINAGVTWTRQRAGGGESQLTVGKVIRRFDTTQFNEATGLSGRQSDWLVSGQFTLGPDLTVANRLLLDNDFSINRNDLRLNWDREKFELSTNFLFHVAEPQVGRLLDTYELHADAQFPLGQFWEGALDMRYDFESNRTAAMGMRVTYKSRCITADFEFQRSFASSASVSPQRDFTISLSVPPNAVAQKRPILTCSR